MELVQQNSPDITYSYGNEASDQIKSTIYHEMAHASHFALVGNGYWHRIRYHIVANEMAGNGPYGSPGNFAAGSAPGRVSLTEAWGFHIGPSFADRYYGGNHRNTNSSRSSTILRFKFLNILEGGGGLSCGGSACDFRFVNDYIPRGLPHDLIDDNATDYPSPGAFEDLGVIDNVSGYTNNLIFTGLNANVTTLGEFQNYINNNRPLGTTQAQVNDLFNSY